MENIERLKGLELLAMRKASVYGRTLTDVELANMMQALAKEHGLRAAALGALLGEKPQKDKGGDDEA